MNDEAPLIVAALLGIGVLPAKSNLTTFMASCASEEIKVQAVLNELGTSDCFCDAAIHANRESVNNKVSCMAWDLMVHVHIPCQWGNEDDDITFVPTDLVLDYSGAEELALRLDSALKKMKVAMRQMEPLSDNLHKLREQQRQDSTPKVPYED